MEKKKLTISLCRYQGFLLLYCYATCYVGELLLISGIEVSL